MVSYTQENRTGTLTTELGADQLLLTGLRATERISESFEVVVDAVSGATQPIHTLLGTAIGVSFDSASNTRVNRDFAGILWQYEELGQDERGFGYRLVLRPAAHLMTLNRRNRIFQNKSAVEIVSAILVGDYASKLNGSYDALEYCVQYQESDFAFASRLLEYEGIYYFYQHAGTASKLVLVDEANAHEDLVPASVAVGARIGGQAIAPIWSVIERRTLGPVKVTVDDYDFEAPQTQLLKSKAAPKPLGAPTQRGGQTAEGSITWADSAELYDFPGKYTKNTVATGERYSANRLDANRRDMARSFAEGSLFAAAVGTRLTLEYENGTSGEYLIVGTTHEYTAPDYTTGGGEESFLCSLELMPAAEQFRPVLATPRPSIPGPQTALVVGPSGEEIYSDKYGRIKVQFPWDRTGGKDEKSSCFIRVVQSAAGQGWGSFTLPRIGQEVVVTFLDGDPDRPLVTGAVYNGSNGTPAALPDNQTQFGLKTRITKEGGGFNHWWVEDKKGSEVVWFRAERDYKAQIVHADEERTYDEGNRKTTFNKGNDELLIDKGTRTQTIEGDDSKTIRSGSLTDIVSKGDETHKVDAGKRTTTIHGNETLEVSNGNRSASIKMGNDELAVALGDISIKADAGKIAIEAAQSIELKVGGSSIKIDPLGIKIQGSLLVDIKGVKLTSSAEVMNTITGGMVMIN